MSAGEFARQADQCIEEIRSRGKVPLLVGGTGLYIRAVLEGLDPLPPRDDQIRKELNLLLEEKGSEFLHLELQKVDPKIAEKIAAADRSRLIRFLELYRLTGRPPSELLQKGRAAQLRYRVTSHWFCPDRELLRKKIKVRVEQMFELGWVDEVKNLMAQGCDPCHWPNKPIGYPEIAQALHDQSNPLSFLEGIVQKTCRYAKRQETFFRGLMKNPAYREGGSQVKIHSGF